MLAYSHLHLAYQFIVLLSGDEELLANTDSK